MARSANGSCTPTEFSSGGSANATGVMVIFEIRIAGRSGLAGYSCRHRARPNMPPYIWLPYRFVYPCWPGPAWSMALA